MTSDKETSGKETSGKETSDKGISRRKFVQGAVAGVIVGGVVAGVGGYYGGASSSSGKTTTATETTTQTAATGAATVTETTTQTTSVVAQASTGGPQEIVIGSSMSLTGPEGPLGPESEWAYNYAVNLVNSQGGIYLSSLGRALPVKLIVLDDQSDQATSVSNMQQLATVNNVNFFLGEGGPNANGDIVVAQEYKTIYMGGSLDTPDIWSAGNPYLFSVFVQLAGAGTSVITPPTQITPFYQWAQSLPAGTAPKNLAMWQEDSDEGNAFCGPTSATVTAAPNYGMNVVFQQKYEPGTTDFTSLITATKAANPDVVIGIPNPTDFITMITGCQELKFSPKLWYISKGWNAQPVVEALGTAAAGVTGETPWAPASPFGQDIAAAWEAAQGSTPAWIPIFFVVNAQILFDAIRIAGTLDTATVRNVLLTNTFYTAVGPIKFQSNGVTYPQQYMIQLQYNGTPNSFGEHVSYNLSPIVYPATGCCQVGATTSATTT